jgi:hypothetical protein
MTWALTTAEKTSYSTRGYLLRESVFSQSQVAAVNEVIDHVETSIVNAAKSGREYWIEDRRFIDYGAHTLQFEPAPMDAHLRVLEPVHSLAHELFELINDDRILDPVRDLIGCEGLSVWTNKINFKRPGGSAFGWHQDAPYWIHDAIDLQKLPNVMIALDDVGPDSGCFRVISGSHRRGILPARNDGSQLEGFFTHPDAVDLKQSIEFSMPAGTLLFFDPLIVHGSTQNSSPLRRRALIATYQPAHYPSLKSKAVVNLGSLG